MEWVNVMIFINPSSFEEVSVRFKFSDMTFNPLLTNCLSVFNHFKSLALKGLKETRKPSKMRPFDFKRK